MTFRRALAVFAPLVGLCLAGCPTSTASHQGSDRLCTPKAEVFCKCQGGKEDGTKTCADSGQEFGPCLPCIEVIPIGGEDTSRQVADADGGQTDVAAPASKESCPGLEAHFDSSQDLQFGGDTAGAKADDTGQGACAAAGGSKDHVYALVADEKGRATLELTGVGAFDATLYVRQGECKLGEQLACSEAKGAGGMEKVVLFVQPDQRLFVFVDGKGASNGSYALKVHLEPGNFCGDGTVDPEEACDDGNLTLGDGCGATCQPDGAPVVAATCPGQQVHVWSNPVTVDGTTDKFANTYKASCGGGASKDAVFAVVPHKAGTLNAVIAKAEFDTVLYARAESCTTGLESACGSLSKGNVGEKIAFQVKKDRTYYIFVDGFKYGKGAFSLQLSIN